MNIRDAFYLEICKDRILRGVKRISLTLETECAYLQTMAYNFGYKTWCFNHGEGCHYHYHFSREYTDGNFNGQR